PAYQDIIRSLPANLATVLFLLFPTKPLSPSHLSLPPLPPLLSFPFPIPHSSLSPSFTPSLASFESTHLPPPPPSLLPHSSLSPLFTPSLAHRSLHPWHLPFALPAAGIRGGRLEQMR
ncbi:unnamed protein product, partial [Closterium sp. NIES-64]